MAKEKGAEKREPERTETQQLGEGLKFQRVFTNAGARPYDKITWEKRDAVITDSKGNIVFEQKGVEIPSFWSQTATNIAVSKYFRGRLNHPERETSAKQLIGRVADTVLKWGHAGNYFASEEDAQTFHAELTHILINQYAAFNSPVWFNVGVEPHPQTSACFILSIDDDMDAIAGNVTIESRIFKWGSGVGVNLSPLRSSKEHVRGGGYASGPVSFLKVFDQNADIIKSGGKTRRAACMRILNVDHPDILEFVECKAKEEKKAHALIDAGYDGSIAGDAYSTVRFQNANHSIRVTDEFMQAFVDDKDWTTRFVTSGEAGPTYKAREIMQKIAQCAWECADPGMQYDTTINQWHTCSKTGRINSSNPCCFTGETLVETAEGRVSFNKLNEGFRAGTKLPRVLSFDAVAGRLTWRGIRRVWKAGETKQLVEVRTQGGLVLRCTPEHRFLRYDGAYVEAANLSAGMFLCGANGVLNEQCSGQAQMLHQAHGGDSVASIKKIHLEAPVPVYDMEVEGVHNFAVTSEGSGANVIVHNSEYMHLDNSACNLASINLLKLRTADGGFDAELYKHIIRVMITAQDILIDNSSFPSEKIEKNAKDFRELGLGYANLGALLMNYGLAYDSDEARNCAAALTALMTGEGYKQSALIAKRTGPYKGYPINREPQLKVIGMHREHAYKIQPQGVPTGVLEAALRSWDEALELGTEHGVKNSQISVLAPTGTISFLMDCDTTGIEPDIALVKYKWLVGGGMLKLVNNTVPNALKVLGYGEGQVQEVLKYIEANDTIEGAPHLKAEHLAVFDCAFKPAKGTRTIHYMGHVRMMAAAQPFISGAISKTVNMPADVTPQDIQEVYVSGWRMGLKAIAIYRDGCKRVQPLTTSKEQGEKSERNKYATRVEEKIIYKPFRHKLPDERKSLTHKFSVAGHEGYLVVGMYEDGNPGEIFIHMSKEGSAISGLMDSFAISVSVALQYGVPLKDLASKYINTRFEPAGVTSNPDIRFAKSLVDYIFKWLALKFLSPEELSLLGLAAPELHPTAKESTKNPSDGAGSPKASGAFQPPAQPLTQYLAPPGSEVTANELTKTIQRETDAPPCTECGAFMVRYAACYRCLNCGATSGCS